MQMELKDILKNETNIVIAGYAAVGKYLLEEIRKCGKQVKISFCDNNRAKHGVQDGIEVSSFENSVETNKGALFLIASIEYAEKMKKQLLTLGVQKNRIIFGDIENLLCDLFEQHIEERKLTPSQFLRMEVSLAEHCNLNCKYCGHFSSIAEPEFIEIEQLERDMKRMSYLLNAKSDKIYLLGGEPLLHKGIVECIEVIRQCFPESRLVILTNGLLLNTMNEAFWETCRNKSVEINITKYPIKIDFDKIIQKIEDEEVYHDYQRKSDEKCVFNKYTIDLMGEQDAYYSFTHCNKANQCHLVKKGKIYTCSLIGCIEHFNKYFKQDLRVTEDDYVDIYSVKDGKELLERLAKPAHFCRYCDIKGQLYELPFEFSKKEMSEWV